MPIYEFSCRGCGEQFDTFVRSRQWDAEARCPACGATGREKLEKRFSVFGMASKSDPGSGVAGAGKRGGCCCSGSCCHKG